MIDWWNVFTNGLWIVGLAVALAALSYTDWTSSRRGDGFLSTLKRILLEPVFLLGLAVACLGAGLGLDVWWRCTLWFLLAAGFAIGTVYLFLCRRRAVSS